MKKVLLTESQVRLINEEIDKNDSIQKLIFADSSEIKFEHTTDSNRVCYLVPVINGKKIKDNYVKIKVAEIKAKGETFYQPHINVNYNIRRLGIAEKLLTTFILQGNKICLLNSDLNQEGHGLLNKLKNNPEISIKPIKFNKKQIGFIAAKK